MASNKVHRSRDLKKVSRSERHLCLEKEHPGGERGGGVPRRDLAQPVYVRDSEEAGMERGNMAEGVAERVLGVTLQPGEDVAPTTHTWLS